DLTKASRAAEDDDVRNRPAMIVAAVRPSSLEAISVPFLVARNWLSGERAPDFADVEGVDAPEPDNKKGKLALRWAGDDSSVISGASLGPGVTIVVPATRGGVRDGCFEPEATAPVMDLAERASLFGRGEPMLRLHPEVLKQLDLSVPTGDPQEARDSLRIV